MENLPWADHRTPARSRWHPQKAQVQFGVLEEAPFHYWQGALSALFRPPIW
ncbi:hypothetical protein [uncultured Erythrobacter sp.]|uniref:hypothetical protein n=1 Tax=uncultured Erythrobacter sp. TaxID=263913 RepID=UPI00262B07F0|nr:hypothetical protein [uncultured Erythrobacter sp.]